MKLMVATPFRGVGMRTARVTLGYHDFVRQLERDMGAQTFDGKLLFSADVVRARNRAVAIILRELTEITHVLWVDDDCWPDDHGIVQRMIDSGEDMIAAPYTNKVPPIHWVHQILSLQLGTVNGLQEVRGVGFGFTLTTRSCLQRVADDSRWYSEYDPLGKRTTVPNAFGMLFDRLTHGDDPEEEVLLSEDFSFCARWRRLGGRVMMLPAVIRHAGERAWGVEDISGTC